jgi:hypothetical protein
MWITTLLPTKLAEFFLLFPQHQPPPFPKKGPICVSENICMGSFFSSKGSIMRGEAVVVVLSSLLLLLEVVVVLLVLELGP